MISYKYTAQSRDGAKVSGVLDAVDEYAAVASIKQEYPIVLSIAEVKQGGMHELLNREINTKIDHKALSVMCSQFSIILSSGVAIDKAIMMVAEQTRDKRLKKMLESSAKDVAQGSTMADAFEKNCPQIPVLFIETIRAGELSGTIDHAFATLQEYYEKSYKVSQKIKQALSYPIFVMVVAVIVIAIVMIVVMPTFISTFNDLGGELPTMTVILIHISSFFSKWWPIILAVILAAVVAARIAVSTEKGRLWWAKHKLTSPITGNINTLQGATQFASTMAALTQAGMTVSDSLRITAKVMDNYALQRDVAPMAEKVETGHTLGEVMKESKYFPHVLDEMTAVGEDTGELGKTLTTIGDYYTNEYNYAVQKAIGKIEPTMLIIMAFIAGFIVIALYLPMFTMYNYM